MLAGFLSLVFGPQLILVSGLWSLFSVSVFFGLWFLVGSFCSFWSHVYGFLVSGLYFLFGLVFGF